MNEDGFPVENDEFPACHVSEHWRVMTLLADQVWSHRLCKWEKETVEYSQIRISCVFMAGQPTPPQRTPPRNKALLRAY